VTGDAREALGDHHAFFHCLVRQHRTGDHVADRIDAVDIGLEMVIDLDAAALVRLDAELREAEILRVGDAADRDEHDIGFDRLRIAALRGLDRDLESRLRLLDLRHLRTELELEALLLEDALEILRDLSVHAGEDRIEEFDDRDLGAEPSPDRAELEADDAAADDEKPLRDFLQCKRSCRGHDLLFVDLDAGKPRDVGPRGDDDVLRFYDPVADLNLARGLDPAFALHPLDLVLLEEELDALGVAVDGLVLEGEELLEVDGRRADIDAHLGEGVARFVEEFRGMQQRLGGNAADIEAGAAQRVALLDAGDLEAELRRADRAFISARARPDHDEVE